MKLSSIGMKRKKKNKKGQSMLDVAVFVVIAIIIVLLFGLFRYSVGLINDNLQSVDMSGNDLGLNMTTIAGNTFGNLNAGMVSLKVVGMCMIFGMILTIFLSNFLVKAHPVFFVGYVLVSILAVILAMMVSNGYSDIMLDSTLNPIFAQDPIGNFIIVYLPIWVTVIAFGGAILLFAGINKDDGMGGGLG